MNNQITNKKLSNAELADRVWRVLVVLLKPYKEAFYSFKHNRRATVYCLAWGTLICLVLLFKWDLAVLNKFGYAHLRPVSSILRFPYFLLLAFSGFYFHGLKRTYNTQLVLNRLTDVFIAANLKNNLGKFPSFVSDEPIDDYTRRMRLTRANLPKESFDKAKGFIESGLQIYIDDVRENRLEGTIDLTYASIPMPDCWQMPDVLNHERWSFVIGKTRSKIIVTDLMKTPHLLVAGQTGGGKSTFLRQFITTIFINNPRTHFTLIDLKGGLEFQLFEKATDRVDVVSDLDGAVEKLNALEELLDRRMAAIKSHNCKDIDAFLKLSPDLLKDTDERLGVTIAADRHVIVIDEAAEIFLTNPGVSAKSTLAAKKVLSKIARQGRSVGVHLVIATQRPDTKTIDPQVKANLPGALCFQMPNDASSITVIGNGRASDLPPVPGRAIWKSGSEQIEVQTPDLSVKYVQDVFYANESENVTPKTAAQNTKVQDEDRTLKELEQKEKLTRTEMDRGTNDNAKA